jgi:hypothetical protein
VACPTRPAQAAGHAARGRRSSLAWVALVVALLAGSALAVDVVAVPSFPARTGVPVELAERFNDHLRAELLARGVTVSSAPLITAGIAGSLDVEFTRLVAELEGSRYALSGELVARPGAAAEPFAVNLLMVDVTQGRSSDVVSRPLAVATLPRVAADLARFVWAFIDTAPELPSGDAALFVSTQPRGAEVRVDGVPVGVSGRLDVISLEAGRYDLEVRLDGYLPELRSVELRPNDTRFVHVVLTEVAGGSIRVTSLPLADVFLDDQPMGPSPVTLTSLPGVREVRIERPGFEPATFTVSVRNFRVHRVDAVLAPLAPTMLVWSRDPGGLVLVDRRLRREGYADVSVGLVQIERVHQGSMRRVLRVVGAPGVYWLDLDSLELAPLAP